MNPEEVYDDGYDTASVTGDDSIEDVEEDVENETPARSRKRKQHNDIEIEWLNSERTDGSRVSFWI